MGLGLSLRKSNNNVRLIRKYIRERTKEKQILNNQLEKLDVQLQKRTIDEFTYERLRDVLEINFIKQQQEALEKTFPRN